MVLTAQLGHCDTKRLEAEFARVFRYLNVQADTKEDLQLH